MSDINFSLGFTTDSSGLKSLESDFTRIMNRAEKISQAISQPNVSTERLDKLKRVYEGLIQKADLLAKVHGELDKMLKDAAQQGSGLESVFVRLGNAATRQDKPLGNFIKNLRQSNTAMQDMSNQKLTSFLGRLEGALGSVTNAVKAQSEAMVRENELTEKNIRLKEAQIRATQASVEARRNAALNTLPPEEDMGGGILAGRLAGTAAQALITAPIYGAAYAATGAVQQAVYDFIEIDTVLNRIAIVSGKTTEDIRAMKEEFMDAARSLSASTKEYVQGALTFYAQGGAAAQYAKELTEVTIQLSNATGQSAKDTSDYITAIGNSFKLIEDGEEGIRKIGDVLLYLDNASATSADEIGQAMRRSASSFEAAGIEYERGAAMIATVSEITRQAPERVGTAFKTIVETIQEVKKAGPKEMKEFTSKIQETIDDFPSLQGKLKLFDESGTQMVETTDFLKQLQGAFAEIKDTDPMAANAIAQAIGGKENANILAALLQNYERFDELLVGIQTESLGSAQKAQEEFQNSLQAKINDLKAAWEEFVNKVLSSKALESIITGLSNAVDIFNSMLGESHQLLKIIVAILFLKALPGAASNLFALLTNSVFGLKKEMVEVNVMAAKGIPLNTATFRTQEELAKMSVIELTKAIRDQNIAIAQNKQMMAGGGAAGSAATFIAGDLANQQNQLKATMTRRLLGGAGTGLLLGGGLTIGAEMLQGKDFSSAVSDNTGMILGGVLGGVAGTLLGPAGTAIGSMVGSMAGDAIQKSFFSDSISEVEESSNEAARSLKQETEEYEKLERKRRLGIELSVKEQNAYDILATKLSGVIDVLNNLSSVEVLSVSQREKIKDFQSKILEGFSEGLGFSGGELKLQIQQENLLAFSEPVLGIYKDKINKMLSSEDFSLKKYENYKIISSIPGTNEDQISKDLSAADFSAKEIEFYNQLSSFNETLNELIIFINEREAGFEKGFVYKETGQIKQEISDIVKKQFTGANFPEDLKIALIDAIDKATNAASDYYRGLSVGGKALAAAAGEEDVSPKALSTMLQGFLGGYGGAHPASGTAFIAGLAGGGVPFEDLKEQTKFIGESSALIADAASSVAKFEKDPNKETYITALLALEPISQKLNIAAGNLIKYNEYGLNKTDKAKISQFNQIFDLVLQKATGVKAPKRSTGTSGGEDNFIASRANFVPVEAPKLDPAAEQNRRLKQLDNIIKNIKDMNATATEKFSMLSLQFEKQDVILLEAQKKYQEAFNKSKNNLTQFVKERSKQLQGLGLVLDKNSGGLYFTEGSIQAIQKKLTDNLNSAKLALYNLGEQTDKNKAAYSKLSASVENAQNILNDFNTSVGEYTEGINRSVESTQKLKDVIKSQSEELMNLQKQMLEEDINEKLFGQPAIDKIQNYFEILKDFQEDYANGLEKTITLSQLQNKLDQDRIKYGTSSQFTEFQKKITSMKKDSKNYTEEEFSLLNAEYDVMLKQILLKKTEQQGQQIQLMRDSEGNWVYGVSSSEKTKEDQSIAQGALLDSAAKFMEQARKVVTGSSAKIFDIAGKITKNDLDIMEAQSVIGSYNPNVTQRERDRAKETLQTLYKIDQTLKSQLAMEQTSLGRQADIYKKAAIVAGAAAADDPLLSGFLDKILSSSAEGIKNVFEKQFPKEVRQPIEASIAELGKVVSILGPTLSNLGSGLEQLKTTTLKINGEISTAGTKLAAAIGDISASLNSTESELSLTSAISKAVSSINLEIKKLLEKAGQEVAKPNIIPGPIPPPAPPVPTKTTPEQNEAFLKGAGPVSPEGAKAFLGKTTEQDSFLNTFSPVFAAPVKKSFASMSASEKLSFIKEQTKEAKEAAANEIDRATDVYNREKAKKTSEGNKAAAEASAWASKIRQAMGYEYYKGGARPWSYDTGGYTGDFDGGRIALLHQKELVLNKQDTKNILDSIKITRDMFSFSNPKEILSAIPSSSTSNSTVINASFPNVSSAEEIRKAFANMSNNAAQFAYRMRPQY